MALETDYSFAMPYLSEGEQILWRGKPGKGHLFSLEELYMIPFSLLWCGFAFYWEYGEIKDGTFFFALSGLPFVLAGLYMVVGRFFFTAWRRKHACYVITNLKVIRKRHKKVDIWSGDQMATIAVDAYRDGNGTIRIEKHSPVGRRRNMGIGMDILDFSVFTLENIPEVRHVQNLLYNINKHPG